jgi:hypothetical protein
MCWEEMRKSTVAGTVWWSTDVLALIIVERARGCALAGRARSAQCFYQCQNIQKSVSTTAMVAALGGILAPGMKAYSQWWINLCICGAFCIGYTAKGSGTFASNLDTWRSTELAAASL